MIRLSAGTAASLGFAGTKMDFYPTTAYLLAGSRCLMNCSFCPQGRSNRSSRVINRLGRITWPDYSWKEVEEALTAAEQKDIKRICLQSVRHADGIVLLLEQLKKLRECSNLPISVSAWIESVDEAEALFSAGAERVSVSVDVVNANAYELFKGGLQEKRVELLLSCAEKYPGKISTHLICGLGESEKEILSMINCFVSLGITVGLFAFTPLKGTDLEKWASPLPGAYRRVQIGHYLLNRNIAAFNDFLFNDEKLISCGLTENNLKKSLADGWAFRTSGCPDCNRPYYNEHPGGELYNYHYPPGKEAIAAALHQSELLNKCSLSEPIRGVKK